MSIWIDKAGRRHVGIMLDGKRVHRIMPPRSSAGDAKRIESEIRAAVGRRSVTIPGDPLIAEAMALYMIAADRLRSPETAKHHARRIGQWIEGHRASDARTVASAIVTDMTGHYEPATINRSLGTLKRGLKLLWESGRCPVDYSTHIKRLPENNARTTYLTVDQVKQIADHASINVRAAIWIALFTACRRGEICKIEQPDIAGDSIRIHAGNTKTLRTRDVPIVGALKPWLRFLPLKINAEGLKTGFRRAREAADMAHVHFHDLRHSCASILIASGVDLYTVGQILGHTSAESTKRYAHMDISQKRDALERTFTPEITQAKPKRKVKTA